MPGYNYPGTSPLKGSRKRRAEKIASNRLDASEKIDEAFGDTLDKSTDLLADDGFTISMEKQSPAPKKSPTKNINWDTINKQISEALSDPELQAQVASTAVESGIQLGAEALKPKDKNIDRGNSMAGFSKLKFGRS